MNPQSTDDQASRGVASVDTVEDFGEGTAGKFKRWKAELDSGKRSETTWMKRAEKTIRRYRDERDAVDAQDRKFNILWANVQTLKPAVYAKPPMPEVSRRFDTSNQVNRVAASILERNLSFTVCEHSQFDATMNACVEDRLLPGRGTAWVRYVADLTPMYAKRPDPLPAPAPAPAQAPVPPGTTELPSGPLGMESSTNGPTPPKTPPQKPADQNKAITDDSYESNVISGEKICFDYVYWKDFRMSPSRIWEECCWVARRVYMTRESGIKRFGEMFQEVPLNFTDKTVNEEGLGNKPFATGTGVLKKAAVWEIWDKDTQKVLWLCEDWPKMLDERDDLFELDEFFPCPKPLLSTTTNESMIPIPDYCMYQDQAQELDQITNRISLLTQALKVIGLYDKTQDGVQRLLTEGVDNVMIPVDNWAMFAERGGLKGTVDFFPVELVSKVLTQLITDRGTVKQDIYEITGIADIVRGASVASETATAQTIKEKFANIRINDVQKDIARFASDLINMAAQLMTNFFQPETLIINADLQDPAGPDFQYVGSAVQLVKDGRLIQHKISVTVDSITAQDDKEEKTARNEFMQNFSLMMQQAVPAVEKMPELAPMIAQVMLWSVRGYKVGRDIEGIIEQSISHMAQQGPPPQKEDPAMVKAKMEGEKMQQEMAMKQADQQAQQAADAAKLQMEQQAQEQELAFKEREHAMELQFKEREFEMKLQFMREENAVKQQNAQVEGAIKVQSAQTDAAIKTQQHEQGLEQSAEAHDASLEQAESAAKQKKEGE